MKEERSFLKKRTQKLLEIENGTSVHDQVGAAAGFV
jgi:hypothetical protein